MNSNQGDNVPQHADHVANSLNCPGNLILKVQRGAIKGAAPAFWLCCPIATVINVESAASMPYLSLDGSPTAPNPLLRQDFRDLTQECEGS
jgi:hypothetical protein